MCAIGPQVPQQLLKTSKLYSRCKKCDIEKTLGVGTTPPPLVARRLTRLLTAIRLTHQSLVLATYCSEGAWRRCRVQVTAGRSPQKRMRVRLKNVYDLRRGAARGGA